MGEVCLADDVMLDRQVALKFVTSGGEDDGLDQLMSEARAAAALDHPFICSIYEVMRLHGRPCIAKEYLRGETLERRLRRGPLALSDGPADDRRARGGAQAARRPRRSEAVERHY
jgi:serine/threonine protein kinase